MGILGFLFGRFGFFANRSSEELAELNAEDVDFPKWIEAHRKWKQRLEAFVEGSSSEVLDPDAVSCDDRCDLGKWIHGNGVRFYGALDVFDSVRKDHAEFHRCAGSVVRCCSDGNLEEGRKVMDDCFARLSTKVVVGLTKLRDRVERG